MQTAPRILYRVGFKDSRIHRSTQYYIRQAQIGLSDKDYDMARPALKFQLEDPMEERVAKLEANVEHIRSDVSDIKTDVRRLNDKIDGVNKDLSGKIDTVIQAIADLKIGRALDRVWWLLMSGALLGIMARAFKWI
jgi:hypothetical protein